MRKGERRSKSDGATLSVNAILGHYEENSSVVEKEGW